MSVVSQPPPRTLNHEGIARRIPHQGTMCLLNSVSYWDSQQISCDANSHRSASNPLRAHDRLGAACGVEYAAQAMAIHGALMAESLPQAGTDSQLASPRAGYLASIRNLALHVLRLDDIPADLIIAAERQSGDSNSILYSFSIRAGANLLLSGRAVVILDSASLGQKALAPSEFKGSSWEKS